MTSCAVVVIGHVDHGKTSLVRVLTGIETDRLKEERERGLSITLGFAHRTYPSGGIDFIDAPGHEDFIRAMISGATGARGVLLVVSAVDGFERQTYEHLQIATLLGVTTGVVAITKADLLPPEAWAARKAEIGEALRGTALDGQPVVLCSALSGQGIDELENALDSLIRKAIPAPRLTGFFLPIDRVFTRQGAGTIVTGTLLSGDLRIGDRALVQPSGRSVIIRGLQAHGEDHQTVEAGRRAAVNLRGASVAEIHPGDVLCAPEVFQASRQIDVDLHLSPTSARALKHMDEVRVMLGTLSVVGVARLLGDAPIAPGQRGLVQLRFAAPILAYAGQRTILRRLSPAETIGGATILDPVAAPTARKTPARLAVLEAAAKGDTLEIATALARRDGGVIALAELQRLSRLDGPTMLGRLAATFHPLGDALMASRPAVITAESAYLARLADGHLRDPLRLGVDIGGLHRRLSLDIAPALISPIQEMLIAAGKIRRVKSQVALAGHDPRQALAPAQELALKRIETALRESGVTPPDREDLCAATPGDDDLLTLLIDLDRAVPLLNHAQRKTLVFHVEALLQAHADLASAFPQATAFTTGEARAVLTTSRKFIVPILEHFDEMRWTVRSGDVRRIAGPKTAAIGFL